ncbi:Pre-mRNA cleavage factor Im 25 kDa subunit 1 [Linum grandiflorum]
MGRELASISSNGDGVEEEQRSSSVTVSIYPLSNYYFGSKESLPSKHDHTLARINSKYSCRGLRTCVEAVILLVGNWCDVRWSCSNTRMY